MHILQIALNILEIVLNILEIALNILEIALNILEIALKVHRQTGPSTSQNIHYKTDTYITRNNRLSSENW